MFPLNEFILVFIPLNIIFVNNIMNVPIDASTNKLAKILPLSRFFAYNDYRYLVNYE